MIFAMSDIHGCIEKFAERREQLLPFLEKGDKLILLGDFIDRGPASFECLLLAKELEDKYGKDQVIVIKGNHEVWFMDFINNLGDDWLAEDYKFTTSKTFLSNEQYEHMLTISSRLERLDFLKKAVWDNHKDLMSWVSDLRLFYETPTQIYVHAGVDEDIPEEEMKYCTLCTGDYTFTGKYPPTKGKFYKDIIAGHVATSRVAGDRSYKGIYFDGNSHFYIDGTVNKNKLLLCLAYDEVKNEYFELGIDGKMKKLK